MKRFVKVMAVVMLVVMSAAVLVSCGVSEKTADKINQAVKEGEAMTYEEVKKLCGGDPTIKIGTTGDNATGEIIWINGCKTSDDVAKKIDAGENVKALYVTFVLGKATVAAYKDYETKK